MKITFFVSFLVAAITHAAPYDDTVKEMQTLAASAPDWVQMIQLEKSDSGKPFYALRINKGAADAPDKIAHLVVAAHHGNEQQSVKVAMQFAKDLVANFKTPFDGGMAKLADYTFYVVPVLNISGFNKGSRYETSASGKTIDPNRDYPDPCGNPQTYQLSSTKSLSNFIKAKNVVGAVTIHGYIGTFTFPWGIFTDAPRTDDDSEFAYISNQSAKENGYETGTHTEVIYPTVGAFEDWAYHDYGVWVTLLEMANGANVMKDSKALLRYFSLVPKERSTKHTHKGNCTEPDGRSDGRSFILSRP